MFLCLLLCGVVVLFRIEGRPKEESAQDASSYMALRDRIGEMTTVEAEAFAKSLEGRKVEWQGYVQDSQSIREGGYRILIDMDPPARRWSLADVIIPISASIPGGRELAHDFTKDERVRFKGTIIDATRTAVGGLLVSVEIESIHAGREPLKRRRPS